jgi:hypothetical protein
VLAVLSGCAILLALVGLGFYAVWKMNPDSFCVRTNLLRLFSFTLEIGSSSGAARTTDSAKRLHEADRQPDAHERQVAPHHRR